ncbi:dTDP-4-dehydrorhamnose reductase [Reinekea marinisedimentorum]|uniref:dTDP-4-dehydrorhamnose reductase n=1 Tax=Reinekea marinisedimentorum TaxID=230495 RepID=A0A4R3I9Z5_9GAMM|nr:dTDP-4-dehydrorhamnose reductase [Reinekea marinisedimentorum]TCS41954.1 dTDP-4-dehydrorhamnose reductase [Reinekea marinisedimentorum]
MKVVVTGKGGQLAWELSQTNPAFVELYSLGIEDLDITDAHATADTIQRIQPEVVINTAAYTAVDKAEADVQNAYAVNRDGARNIAEACRQTGARLLHVSTDFVFDGTQTIPYTAESKPNPVSVYGASKLAGDIAVAKLLPESSLIVRTAWVYSANGNNFVKTMLRLMREKPELGIVYDQVGTPTWAKGLAQWLWAIAVKPELNGLYNWTDAGVASWYDFAIAIQELAVEKGLLSSAIPIKPIPASDYPTPAKRPHYSVLDKAPAELASGLATIHWRKQLSFMLDDVKRISESNSAND